MKSGGSWLRRALAIASAILCVVFMAVALLLVGVQRAAGNQARVTDVLTNAFVRSGVLTDMLAPDLVKGFGGERALATVTQDEMREILRTLFPVEWQEAQARQLASQAYAYLFGNGSNLALSISLEEPRRLMAGQAGTRVAQIIVRSWPACTPEQIDKLNSAPDILPEMFGCEPPEPAASRVLKALALSLGKLAEAMPEKYNIGSEPGSSGPLREVHAILETLALWMVLSILISGAGLLFALAIAARSLKAVMRWAGISWMSGAALAIVLALVILAARNRLFTGLVAATPALSEAVATVARGLVGLAMGATFVVSVVALVVGSGVTAVSFALKKPAVVQVEDKAERVREGSKGERGSAGSAAPPKKALGGRETLPLAPSSGPTADEEGDRPRGLFG